MTLDDAKIIENLPLSRTQKIDQDGCHFTKNGIYTVISGYQMERVWPNIGVSGVWTKCYPFEGIMLENTRGIQGPTQCTRCSAEEKSMNQVFLNVSGCPSLGSLTDSIEPNFFFFPY